MNAAGLLAVRISGKEERKRFVCGSATDDEVAAAAEAHGEAGAAAEVAQGHFGAGLLASHRRVRFRVVEVLPVLNTSVLTP